MANDEKTERLQVVVATETVDYLKQLAQLGTHGPTHTKVARSLIEEGVRNAIKDGFISARRPAD
jgi:hypothetical protein